MNKVATTYWDDSNAVFMPAAKNSRTRTSSRTREKTVKTGSKESSQVLVFTIIVVLSSMICLTVNIRAFVDRRQEVQQYEVLNSEVDKLTNENLALQEEIKLIKTDALTIETEARKLGMSRPDEKVLVPEN